MLLCDVLPGRRFYVKSNREHLEGPPTGYTIMIVYMEILGRISTLKNKLCTNPRLFCHDISSSIARSWDYSESLISN
jgi:hypothetical protein